MQIGKIKLSEFWSVVISVTFGAGFISGIIGLGIGALCFLPGIINMGNLLAPFLGVSTFFIGLVIGLPIGIISAIINLHKQKKERAANDIWDSIKESGILNKK
jgi:hypothetical protein